MGSEKHEKKERKHEKKDKKKKKEKDSKHKKKKSDKKDSKKKEKDSKHKKHNKSSSSSSSDDEGPKVDIGPAMPPGIGPTMPPGIVLGGSDTAAPDIGPALPPGVVLPSSNYVQDEESDDEAGPSAHPAAPENADADDGAGKEADAGTQQEAGTADGETKRRAGPALPAGVDLEKIAAQAAKVDWQRVEEAEEEDEEDLVGPAMPGQVTLGFVKASIAAEERALANAIAEHERRLHGEKPAHEEWMTALPDVKALGFTLDQLQQTRTFQRKEHVERGDTSAWTDSPADKAAKAREKAMGIKRKAAEGPPAIDTSAAAISVVHQYNAALRPKSLVEMHKEELAKRHKAGGGQGAGTVAPGAWDKAEMQQVRAKDKKSADKMLQDAQTLGGRFGGGSFHGI